MPFKNQQSFILPFFYYSLLQLYYWIHGNYVASNTHFYFYQQSGDAKKPYFVQYSAVCEDVPVRRS
jgi:hypothetical protein